MNLSRVLAYFRRSRGTTLGWDYGSPSGSFRKYFFIRECYRASSCYAASFYLRNDTLFEVSLNVDNISFWIGNVGYLVASPNSTICNMYYRHKPPLSTRIWELERDT